MTDYNHDPLVPRCGLAAALAGATAYPNELLWTTDTKNLYVEQGGAKILVGGSIGVPHNVLSATHLDSTVAACVRGDIITGQGVNPTWTRLPAAAVPGCYLASGVEPSWALLNQAAVDGLTTGSSPAFVTVKLSGLTDGYIPYHVSDAAGLANSPIYTDGTKVGIGGVPGSILALYASSNSGSGSGYPLLTVKNTLATQGDGATTYNFAGILVDAGNDAVQIYFSATYADGVWAPAGHLNVVTNHPLIIKTNNTERMRITEGVIVGNSGTDPGLHNLLVDGTLHVDGVATFDAQIDFGTAHGTTLLIDHIGEHTGSHGIVADNTVNSRTQSLYGYLLSNSNIAHGMTDLVPTDVGGAIGLTGSTSGGITIRGFTDMQSTAMWLKGTIGVTAPAPICAVIISGSKVSAGGTTDQNLADAEEILDICNRTDTKAIFYGNGDLTLYGKLLADHIGEKTGSHGVVVDDILSTAADNALGGKLSIKSYTPAVASITGATIVVDISAIPLYVLIIGVQANVTEALAAGELWDFALELSGTHYTLASAQAVAANTKVNRAYSIVNYTDAGLNLDITKNGGGNFTAQGKIQFIVYYVELDSMTSV